MAGNCGGLTDSATQEMPALRIPWAAFSLVAIWTWAIWSCAEHWRGNPNYSYGWAVPPLVLGFPIRRYFTVSPAAQIPSRKFSTVAAILLALALGGFVFLLEYSREQM